jgi:hypothetical protein
MPYADAEARKEYHRAYMRAYYHKRKHEERKLLGRRNTVGHSRNLPAPTRPEPSVCEICGSPEKNGTSRSLALDHDHETGAFRGWLCNDCNLILGRIGDNLPGVESWASNAVAYLRRSKN